MAVAVASLDDDAVVARPPLRPLASRGRDAVGARAERFPIDRFDGTAWIGVVPFRMRDVAPRGVPALPWLSAFPELNVRTYVRVADKPGVYFFSLDAANPLAVRAARFDPVRALRNE